MPIPIPQPLVLVGQFEPGRQSFASWLNDKRFIRSSHTTLEGVTYWRDGSRIYRQTRQGIVRIDNLWN